MSAGGSNSLVPYTAQRSEEDGLSLQRVLDNLYTKLFPQGASELFQHTWFRCLYILNPKMFQIGRGVHLALNGPTTHFSIRIYYSKEGFYNAHVYGTIKGKMFVVSTVEYYNRDRQAIVHNFTLPQAAASPAENSTNGW